MGGNSRTKASIGSLFEMQVPFEERGELKSV